MTVPLTGFDAEYADLHDFIMKITWRIWEGGGIERIRDYYAPDGPVKTPGGVSDTLQEVIDSTRATLAVFPDRQLYGEDVVGSEDAPGRFYSSHRILSQMTHAGESPDFGPATGKRIHARTIADCVCVANQVVDEWMVRDNAAVATQLGIDHGLHAKARREKAGRAFSVGELIERWTCGVHNPKGDDPQDIPEGAARHAAAQEKLVRGELDGLSDAHDRACSAWLPDNCWAGGRDALADCWREHANALPGQQFRVHHAIAEDDPDGGLRTALRWSCIAKHADGMYGSGTGREIALLGITHAEWRRSKIIREWQLWDAISIREQLL